MINLGFVLRFFVNWAPGARLLSRDDEDDVIMAHQQSIKCEKFLLCKHLRLTSVLAYVHDDLHDYQPTRMLRSSNAYLLQRPLVLISVAFRAFAVAAPTVWNLVSVNVRPAKSFASFKRRLKSELLASTYATQDGSAPLQCSESCFSPPSGLKISVVVVAVAVIVVYFHLTSLFTRSRVKWSPKSLWKVM